MGKCTSIGWTSGRKLCITLLIISQDLLALDTRVQSLPVMYRGWAGVRQRQRVALAAHADAAPRCAPVCHATVCAQVHAQGVYDDIVISPLFCTLTVMGVSAVLAGPCSTAPPLAGS